MGPEYFPNTLTNVAAAAGYKDIIFFFHDLLRLRMLDKYGMSGSIFMTSSIKGAVSYGVDLISKLRFVVLIITHEAIPPVSLDCPTDPQLINDKFGKQVDLVIDGGIGGITPSTIISFVSGEAEVIREGAGQVI